MGWFCVSHCLTAGAGVCAVRRLVAQRPLPQRALYFLLQHRRQHGQLAPKHSQQHLPATCLQQSSVQMTRQRLQRLSDLPQVLALQLALPTTSQRRRRPAPTRP